MSPIPYPRSAQGLAEAATTKAALTVTGSVKLAPHAAKDPMEPLMLAAWPWPCVARAGLHQSRACAAGTSPPPGRPDGSPSNWWA